VSTNPACRLFAGAAVAAVTIGLLASPAIADPPNHSDHQLSRAHARVQSTAGQVGQISAQLSAKDAELTQVKQQAEIAYQQYYKALDVEQAATTAARMAAAKAGAAARRVTSERAKLGDYAADNYKAGGSLGPLTAMLTAQTPEDVLHDAGTMKIIGDRQNQTLQSLNRARAAQANASSLARAALIRQHRAREAAQHAKAAAEAKVAGVQATVQRIQTEKATLRRQLAAAQARAGILDQARAAAVARAKAAAAARAAAARRAAAQAAAAREAANAAAAREAAANAAAAREAAANAAAAREAAANAAAAHEAAANAAAAHEAASNAAAAGEAAAQQPSTSSPSSSGSASSASSTSSSSSASASSSSTSTSSSSRSSNPGSSSSSSSSSSTQPVSSAPTVQHSSAGAAAIAIRAALAQLGTPYVWGGKSPGGFDCSGLTRWAYLQAGITLPYFSGDQYYAGYQVSINALAPGDLIFYSSNGAPSGIHHVAMYIGGGQMVEAPTFGIPVQVRSIYYEGLLPYGSRVG